MKHTSRQIRVRALDERADTLSLHAAFPERYPYFLESAASGTPHGRYDILFAFPGESLRLDRARGLHGPHAGRTGFLGALDEWQMAEQSVALDDSGLPFRGGWFVFLAYEMAGEAEPVLDLPRDNPLPLAVATRIPAAVIHDHESGRSFLVAETGSEALIERMLEDLRAVGPFREKPGAVLEGDLEEDPPERYLETVRRAREYVHDGDIFQANLSRKWKGRVRDPLRPVDVYARLRRNNPGPFSGLAVFGEQAVISSSPERLASLRGDRLDTRPIAGTRPRNQDRERDRALSGELMGHPKERAEHVMLIDLERNDVGRVARPGTVHVDELMVLESYAHVHHIVSNVTGRVRDGVTPGEAIRAVFPGGTITGCPKVRCMEIIGEQEGTARGAYTGSMGYLNRDGDMDLNILIRTLEMNGRDISLRAGAGIVADSVPERELEETRAKARGLVLALERDRG